MSAHILATWRRTTLAASIGMLACGLSVASWAQSVSQDGKNDTKKAEGKTEIKAEPDPNQKRSADSIGEVVSEIDNSCWVIFQDKDNNYWFGSDGQGVSRYDGKIITRFTTQHGLSDNHIRGIQQHAPTGDILISTNSGVSKFDGKQLVTLPMMEMKSLDEGWVLDPDDVWIQGKSGPKGPCRYDGKTLYALQLPKSPHADEWYAKHPNAPWNPYDVWCVYKDRNGYMWFGTATLGICRFDGKSRGWMYEAHLSELPNNALFGIRSIIQDKNNDFWFCNTQYRFAMSPRGAAGSKPGEIAYSRKPGMDLTGTTIDEKFFYFMSIAADERGDLWMAPYGGGVWKYDGTKLTNYPMKNGDEDITMYSIYRDRRGDLWVGTHNHGPFKFNGKAFERFRP